MKIQCDVCERAEATVLCCADEAALCWGCDERVHAANKLAEKHQRVPLFTDPSSSKSSSSQIPSCDICQERTGYFFCLEDRALLCRQCDISIHTASPHVSCHQRFLITGVRVALQQHLTTSRSSKYNSNERNNNSTSLGPRSSVSTTTTTTCSTVAVEDAEGFRPLSPWNEMFDTADDFDRCYHMFSGPGSSN